MSAAQLAAISAELTNLQLELDALGAAMNSTISSQAQNSDDFFLIVMGAFVYRTFIRIASGSISVTLTNLVMQPGFAFLEAGLMRQPHVANTLFRNILGSGNY